MTEVRGNEVEGNIVVARAAVRHNANGNANGGMLKVARTPRFSYWAFGC